MKCLQDNAFKKFFCAFAHRFMSSLCLQLYNTAKIFQTVDENYNIILYFSTHCADIKACRAEIQVVNQWES